MKKLKPTQKLINFKNNKLSIHDAAVDAFRVWNRFRQMNASCSLQEINPYFRPPIKLIDSPKKQTYFFFDQFYLIEKFNNSLHNIQHHCLIYDVNKQCITTVAWREVLLLAFQRGINHFDLYSELITYLAEQPSILINLFGTGKIDSHSYCQFAQIDFSTFEYHRSKSHRIKKDNATFIERHSLPKNTDWLR